MSDTAEDRIAARREAEDRVRVELAGVNLDGPHRFPEGGMFGGMFGGTLDRFAICTLCGPMVMLHDAAENPDGTAYERGASLHAQWHQDHA